MADKETLLKMCRAGDTEWVRRALSRGEDFKEVGGEAVTVAASRGHVDTVAVLLEVGRIDVNATNKWGETALHRAALYSHTNVLTLLLHQPGIEINQADDDGWTVLHMAACQGHTNVLMLLSNFPGINLAATTKRGETVLHYLVDWDPDFLRNFLTNLNVDPNAKDYQSNTPIMNLLKTYNPNNNVTECLRVMVESDRVEILHVKDRQGRSLEDLARYYLFF